MKISENIKTVIWSGAIGIFGTLLGSGLGAFSNQVVWNQQQTAYINSKKLILIEHLAKHKEISTDTGCDSVRKAELSSKLALVSVYFESEVRKEAVKLSKTGVCNIPSNSLSLLIDAMQEEYLNN